MRVMLAAWLAAVAVAGCGVAAGPDDAARGDGAADGDPVPACAYEPVRDPAAPVAAYETCGRGSDRCDAPGGACDAFDYTNPRSRVCRPACADRADCPPWAGDPAARRECMGGRCFVSPLGACPAQQGGVNAVCVGLGCG